jgi:hypothetical protein
MPSICTSQNNQTKNPTHTVTASPLQNSSSFICIQTKQQTLRMNLPANCIGSRQATHLTMPNTNINKNFKKRTIAALA